MIVILKRDDLLPEHRNRKVEDLQMSYFQLSQAVIEEADLIVFLEGSEINFLKHLSGIQSQENLTIFMDFITSTPPAPKERPTWRKKRSGRRSTKD